jgi:hypothetical protein
LEATKAVTIVEGVVEVLGDLDEVFAIGRSCSPPTALGCPQRWLEGTRIENKKKVPLRPAGPIAVLAPHVWDEVVTSTGNAWRLGRIDFGHCVCSATLGSLSKVDPSWREQLDINVLHASINKRNFQGLYKY